ncbi:methyltransferase domain-containing protein [Paucihalobacter sp.]|uniref:methyltransferase domain-containing protein n=1 Tax=Paucihalobacter sp. TaxID=2850405 RepID=UPI002FE1E13E
MPINTTYRSTEQELMDDFTMQGELLRDTLDKLGNINKWLGGNRITLNGVEKLLQEKDKSQTYTIVDLGCGHGDILRLIAQWGRRHNFKLKLIGIDANTYAIAYANELSSEFPELHFKVSDVFSEDFEKLNCDIILSTLFLHHFKDEDIVQLLNTFSKNANLGIVVNDLQRSKLAYFLFQCLGLVISNHMIKQDGLISIKRAFKKNELIKFSEQLNLNYNIRWQWAFRYQWVITT